MRKALLFAALVGCLVAAGSADATLPCAAYSSCAISATQSCADAGLRWCPKGDYGLITIRVTVRNCLNSPLAGCPVRLDISATGDTQNELATAALMIVGAASRLDTSDANGAVSYDITGGGCGRFQLNWTATATCATPEVQLCSNSTVYCVKSPDLNGNGGVNFLDTFKYAPQLSAGIGYCGDFNCNGAVNFLDTFVYAPHLSHGGTYAGFTMAVSALGECP
jgi:hypothetical protein